MEKSRFKVSFGNILIGFILCSFVYIPITQSAVDQAVQAERAKQLRPVTGRVKVHKAESRTACDPDLVDRCA